MPALITYRTPVQEDWVDYNGHLRDAYYLLIFSYATDALMERIGLMPTAAGKAAIRCSPWKRTSTTCTK